MVSAPRRARRARAGGHTIASAVAEGLKMVT